jgi:hypothetical protein
MDRALSLVFIILVLLGGAMPVRAAEARRWSAAPHHRSAGVARTRPRQVCRGASHAPERSVDTPMTGGEIVRPAFDGNGPHGARWRVRALYREAQGGLPNETIGVGTGPRFSVVRSRAACSGDARFVLGRHRQPMDRAFVSPENCGEVRLIYRLTRTAQAARTARRGACR